jgi:heme/copper-type cytochrome/quinol oxidase subunit 3
MADSTVIRLDAVAQARLRRATARRPPEAPAAAPPISNARLAMVMLLVGEVMFFAGLIGAYLVFRVGSTAWPPPTLPRLPLAVTWINTGVLLASGVTMIRARRAATRDDQPALRRGVAVTAFLGLVFLAVQGSEWVRLIHHGLTLSSGMYGATFYALIGTHAAHVVGAVLWLGVVWIWARQGHFTDGNDAAVDACAIYWLFVCALWVVLFAMVYQ